MSDLNIGLPKFELTAKTRSNLLTNVGLSEAIFPLLERETAHYLKSTFEKKTMSPAEGAKNTLDMLHCIKRLLSHLNEVDQYFEDTLIRFDDGHASRRKTELLNQLEAYLPIATKAHQSFLLQKKDGRRKDWALRIWVSSIKRVLTKHGVPLGEKNSTLTRTISYLALSLPEGTPEINASRIVRTMYPEDKTTEV